MKRLFEVVTLGNKVLKPRQFFEKKTGDAGAKRFRDKAKKDNGSDLKIILGPDHVFFGAKLGNPRTHSHNAKGLSGRK